MWWTVVCCWRKWPESVSLHISFWIFGWNFWTVRSCLRRRTRWPERRMERRREFRTWGLFVLHWLLIERLSLGWTQRCIWIGHCRQKNLIDLFVFRLVSNCFLDPVNYQGWIIELSPTRQERRRLVSIVRNLTADIRERRALSRPNWGKQPVLFEFSKSERHVCFPCTSNPQRSCSNGRQSMSVAAIRTSACDWLLKVESQKFYTGGSTANSRCTLLESQAYLCLMSFVVRWTWQVLNPWLSIWSPFEAI